VVCIVIYYTLFRSKRLGYPWDLGCVLIELLKMMDGHHTKYMINDRL
jgi:hypothetical protein